MDFELVLYFVALVAITNVIGFIVGPILIKVLNWFKSEPWNFITFAPKLMCGILSPIFFGFGFYFRNRLKNKINEKKMDDGFRNGLKNKKKKMDDGATYINGVESYGYDDDVLDDIIGDNPSNVTDDDLKL